MRPTSKDIVPGDADDEPPDDAAQNDAGGDGSPWNDPEFHTPSTITLSGKTFTGIQWLRPPVSATHDKNNNNNNNQA